MTSEADDGGRRIAYLEQIRGLYRRERTIGLMGCLGGVLLLVWARYRMTGAAWAMWLAVGVIGVSWLLFAYVVLRRARWVRAHPFDPNG